MRTLASTSSEERSDPGQEPISEPPPEKRSDLVQDPTPGKAPEKRPKLDDSDVSSCLLSKRRVEGNPEDDRRKQAKRPREEDDEHRADDGYTDGSPFVEDKVSHNSLPPTTSRMLADPNMFILAKHPMEEVDLDVPPFVDDKGDIEEEEDYDEEYDYDEGFARRELVCRSFFDDGDFSEDDNEDWGVLCCGLEPTGLLQVVGI